MQMIRIKNKELGIISLLLLLWSCESHDNFTTEASEGTVAVRMATSSMANSNELEAETRIQHLQGFRFEDEILTEVFGQLAVDEEGICYLQPAQMRGNVYFLANATEATKNQYFETGITTFNEFLQWKATAEAMTTEGIAMTGQIELSATIPSQVSVPMERTIARIDLDSPFENVEVHSITLRNMATSGYINKQNDLQNIDIALGDLSLTFDEVAFQNKKETLFYVCEDDQETHEVEIMVSIQGAWHRLRTELPAIKRNKIYTLMIYGNGADIQVKVLTDSWEHGISSESDLGLKGWIDKASSLLPEGVKLSPKGDTAYIPYTKTNLQLALQSDQDMEVQVNGFIEGAIVTPRLSRSLGKKTTMIDITSAKRMPGTIVEHIYLDLYKQQIHQGRVVLVFSPNPLKMKGKMQFDANSVCDFNGYADGTLAEFTTENGFTLELETDGEGPEWAKLYPEEQPNTYSLEGGWRPNDPEADGRVQTAQLFIKDTNGNRIDAYTIKRQNWGLPVVNINGTWWCKYNLRGNVKNFEDQILLANDPVGDGSLAEYLTSCSDDDFLSILGDQYQGGNPEGLELKYDGEYFYYEGFQSTAQDFGSLTPTEMAPSGYEIPDYNDFRFFAWNHDSGLGYGNGEFSNKVGEGSGARIYYTSRERIASFKGGSYGPIHFYDFSYEGNHWVMLGLGHQWEPTNGSIAKMMVLMATSGTPGKTWFLEGYALNSANQGTTWVKYANQNASKTRTIRCIKSEVKYMY